MIDAFKAFFLSPHLAPFAWSLPLGPSQYTKFNMYFLCRRQRSACLSSPSDADCSCSIAVEMQQNMSAVVYYIVYHDEFASCKILT